MIPSYQDVDAAFGLLARRYGLRNTLHFEGVRRALALARELAEAEIDEPAALFFAQ
jgi:hypothetical protein